MDEKPKLLRNNWGEGAGGKPPTRKCRQAPRVADVSARPLWLHTRLDVKRAHVREIRRLGGQRTAGPSASLC